MDKDEVLTIIRRFHSALSARGIKASKLILYGSYARGDYHEGSDIDLVVISEDFQGRGYWERIDILAECICELFEPIEAVAMTPEEWEEGRSLIVQFASQGEVVFSA